MAKIIVVRKNNKTLLRVLAPDLLDYYNDEIKSSYTSIDEFISVLQTIRNSAAERREEYARQLVPALQTAIQLNNTQTHDINYLSITRIIRNIDELYAIADQYLKDNTELYDSLYTQSEMIGELDYLRYILEYLTYSMDSTSASKLTVTITSD